MKVSKVLKHLFVPHSENDFKPHFFREAAVGTMVLVSVFLLGVSFGSSHFIHKTVRGATIASSVLVDLTNESRIREHEIPLLKNEKLTQAAQLKGEDMAAKEYFAHNSPDGVTPWYWFKKVGYSFLYAGENLAIDFTDASDVEKAWLNSPKHRANILNGEFREIGIAAVQGVYNNAETIYIVQMFGTPAYAEIASTSIPYSEVVKERKTATQDKKVLHLTSTTSSTFGDVISGDVKGDSVGATTVLQNVENSGDFIAVKNTGAMQISELEKLTVPVYSTWYDKIIFFWSRYLDVLYKIILGVTVIALIIMLIVEIRKQHLRHIFYAVSLLFLLQLFIYINQSLF